ncbi:MAG: GGDEF domain-containing protein [Oscillospiraceae bacterium]|nr:GGDEF domain-containing protein [Oscillospiraceae bacterium]
MKRSTEENILHLKKWNSRLIKLNWSLFGILVFFEALIALFYCMGYTRDAEIRKFDYIIYFFLVPASIVLVTILVMQLINTKLISRFSLMAQGRFSVLTLILIISEAVAFHHGINVVYALYVLPLVVSIIYVDRLTLQMAYGLSIITYMIVFGFYIRYFVPTVQYSHSYMDVFGTVGIITAVYTLCEMVLTRFRELINLAVDQSVQRMELSKEVSLDSLTQLYNHATFYDKLDEFILNSRNLNRPFSLIIVDIDNFKSINDRYGHDVGNVVLLGLVSTIKQVIGEKDLAFRYGGEEFTVLTSDANAAFETAEKIRTGFSARVFPAFEHAVTLSAGLCTYDRSYGGRREFFSAADKALYKAKQSGKNCTCVAET